MLELRIREDVTVASTARRAGVKTAELVKVLNNDLGQFIRAGDHIPSMFAEVAVDFIKGQIEAPDESDSWVSFRYPPPLPEYGTPEDFIASVTKGES